MPPGHPVYCVWERGGMRLSVTFGCCPRSSLHKSIVRRACMHDQVNNGERTKNKKGQQGTHMAAREIIAHKASSFRLPPQTFLPVDAEQRGKPGLFPLRVRRPFPCLVPLSCTRLSTPVTIQHVHCLLVVGFLVPRRPKPHPKHASPSTQTIYHIGEQ